MSNLRYIFGSLFTGFIFETFLLSVLYAISNKFTLLPYRLFGFSGKNTPAPAFVQFEMTLILFTPYAIATLLIAYWTRSYPLKQFVFSIALVNFYMYVLQIILFTNPDAIIYMPASIVSQVIRSFIATFLPVTPLIFVLASFVRRSSLFKGHNEVKSLAK
jgi:hypothetical protein